MRINIISQFAGNALNRRPNAKGSILGEQASIGDEEHQFLSNHTVALACWRRRAPANRKNTILVLAVKKAALAVWRQNAAEGGVVGETTGRLEILSIFYYRELAYVPYLPLGRWRSGKPQTKNARAEVLNSENYDHQRPSVYHFRNRLIMNRSGSIPLRNV
jgi:hypothetical protein